MDEQQREGEEFEDWVTREVFRKYGILIVPLTGLDVGTRLAVMQKAFAEMRGEKVN